MGFPPKSAPPIAPPGAQVGGAMTPPRAQGGKKFGKGGGFKKGGGGKPFGGGRPMSGGGRY